MDKRFDDAAFARAHREGGTRAVRELAKEMDRVAREAPPPRQHVEEDIALAIAKRGYWFGPLDAGMDLAHQRARVKSGVTGLLADFADGLRIALRGY